MQRSHGLDVLDVVFAGVLSLVALAVIARSAVLLIAEPPQSWAYVVAFGVAVALTASFRIELGRRSGMPLSGVGVALVVIVSPDADPLRVLGIWTAATLLVQLVKTRNAAVAGYITGLGSLATFAYLVLYDALRGVVWVPVALLLATAAFLAFVLAVDFVRQRGRWGLDGEVGTGALVPRRVAALFLLLWLFATALWFLDSAVVPAMAATPGLEQSPMLVLVAGALVFSVAKRIEVRRVRRRLAGVLDAALELPWGGVSEAERALVAHARTSIAADVLEVRDEPASGNEIGSALLLPGGRSRYLVASQRMSAVPFDTEDEQILDALAHMGTDTLSARDDVESLRRYVDRDALTGLPNRRAFQSALAVANRDRRPFEGIAVLFLDLDDFKDLNDGRGHHVGDKMLRMVGRRLGEAVDADGGFAARVGGDEFVVILRGLRSADDARRRAQLLVEMISAPETVEGDTLAPVVSVGVAFSAHEEADPSTIVIEADRSMLALKRTRSRSGRERASALDVTSVVRDPLRAAAARAVREESLDVAFQPVVELSSGRIWAFEALVRLEDPALGSIDPPALVSAVRELGLLDELTMQVVEKAMHAAVSFRAWVPGIDCMAVNVDLEQLAVERLGGYFAGLPERFPEIRVCVELNERSVDEADDSLRDQAQRLRDAGLLIALDDYGAKGTSVAAVATFPLDILKLDRTLLADLATEQRKQEIVRALQGFAVAVGIRVIVEGAEDDATVAILGELGVTDVQGYLFGRPDTRTGAEHRLHTTGSSAIASLD
ncbi:MULTISPECIES: EAL domain-containing protein [unclassified Rathayibacter]|uniref:EAL domain-containing protein n=1 Tax=unclassified Rathayibacter TaxID=2609250 RepID=UPI00188AA44D|nr:MULTISPECIES: EAL domain-containing protein [unclassified Rathayibacter]MBF4461028.1 EAL domain-containing protein [Rathayibacter sp. VKM Ac-2879]MBF4502439.1 EAL domain-containing protein [Rathayibacter sp. VKM Ac-2878]